MGRQVIRKHNVALAQSRYQNLLDVREEGDAIHGTIEYEVRREAIDAKGGDIRQRLPMAMRYRPHETLPARRASVVPDHFCRDRRLINKHKAPRIKTGLLGFEFGACCGHVRTILLGGAQSFFEGNVVTIVEAPDRAYCCLHPLLGTQSRADLLKCQIRLLGNKFEQPLFVSLERRAGVARARLRLDAAGLGPALDPTDRSRGAEIE